MAFIHKHTPGDWKVIDGLDKDGNWNLFPSVLFFGTKEDYQKSMGRTGIPINCSHNQEPESLMANAKLISQSPSLLEIAEMYYDEMKQKEVKPIFFDQVEKTIEACGVEITHK
jgi:hypothetical protein